ncbi:FKBP-type peptidyl-prolyl cis-trans isomerase [Gordonia sp. ABSL1-1]|uniref:FKBP-type peptidyl-prolyl cis-trans isomerase n=1 Tax=Gordonia sp. ABSL1-1 TaxID=3053923 RepID=UPI00257417AC|nr:FKBP-type peptidyl-prolyl cis-trans isomerase [Gordonia sp. ABSL1-1]MDL9938826.1 FKBP-type peptidyl-prolyl cis-trans isomerase [Gordonia sp. ABSL1-1]
MMLRRAALVPIAVVMMAGLAACGSDSDDSSASPTDETTVATEATGTQTTGTETPDTSSCPTEASDGSGPKWTLDGTSGKVQVTGSTAKTAPKIEVTAPFAIGQTTVHTLAEGSGPVVAETATVLVCYEGVNGRTGKEFDSSYQTGQPIDFPLNGVIPGFSKAIAGQKVGSTVAVAMTSADGYAEGNPSAGIERGDTLIFEIRILAAQG